MPTTLDKIMLLLTEEYTIDVTPESNLESLGLDSIDVVEFGMLLEEEFDTEIPDEKLSITMTVRELAELVKGGSDE